MAQMIKEECFKAEILIPKMDCFMAEIWIAAVWKNKEKEKFQAKCIEIF
jgi:hypothetical protein